MLRRKLFFVFAVSSWRVLLAQAPWQDLGPLTPVSSPRAQAARRIQLDRPRLEMLLARAPAMGSAAVAALLELPGPDGLVHSLSVRESPVLSGDLQVRMPELRTYAVTGVRNPSLTGRLDLTPAGFHAVVVSPEGAFVVEPDGYGSYRSAWLGSPNPRAFSCGVTTQMTRRAGPQAVDFAFPKVATQLQTLRLAVMVTAQFTHQVGATEDAARAAIVTTINATNEVFEREAFHSPQCCENDRIFGSITGALPRLGGR